MFYSKNIILDNIESEIDRIIIKIKNLKEVYEIWRYDKDSVVFIINFSFNRKIQNTRN